MALKIGINGFGRIGRMILRSIVESNRKDLEVIKINNRGNNEISSFLLEHDTIHGQLKAKVSYDDKSIFVNDKKINLSHETEISKINWKNHNIDLVLECTGKFNTKENSSEHLKSGAKKVLVSAPCKGATNIVFGVNEKKISSTDRIISAASCTTNCLAPVAKVINDNFGIERGFMTTIHSYTSDQNLLDNSHKDLRRARSAGNSMIPTTTGATKSLGDVIPELKNKIEGISIRVPTPNVSLVELVFSSKKDLKSLILKTLTSFIFVKKLDQLIISVYWKYAFFINYNYRYFEMFYN